MKLKGKQQITTIAIHRYHFASFSSPHGLNGVMDTQIKGFHAMKPNKIRLAKQNMTFVYMNPPEINHLIGF
jgi:hypothetical protein